MRTTFRCSDDAIESRGIRFTMFSFVFTRLSAAGRHVQVQRTGTVVRRLRGDRPEPWPDQRRPSAVRDQVLPRPRVRDRHWPDRNSVPQDPAHTARAHLAGKLQHRRAVDRIPK